MSSLPFESAADPSDEPNNVTALPSRLAKQANNLIGPREVLDAAEALRDMRIPDPPRSSLSEALVGAGYDVAEEELVHQFDRDYLSQVLAVRPPGGQRALFLIHIPQEILNVKHGDYQRAVIWLKFLFQPGSSLTVVSTGLPDPQGTYIQILDGWRGEGGIDARFVSWRRIEELEESGFQPTDVARDLRINDVLGGAAAQGNSDSITAHEPEIAQILEDQASSFLSGSEEYFDGLIARFGAAIPPPWVNQLQDVGKSDPRSAAPSLVRWAIRKGELPKGGATAIGLLMVELSEDVGGQENRRLFELIEQYELLPSDEIGRRRGD